MSLFTRGLCERILLRSVNNGWVMMCNPHDVVVLLVTSRKGHGRYQLIHLQCILWNSGVSSAAGSDESCGTRKTSIIASRYIERHCRYMLQYTKVSVGITFIAPTDCVRASMRKQRPISRSLVGSILSSLFQRLASQLSRSFLDGIMPMALYILRLPCFNVQAKTVARSLLPSNE